MICIIATITYGFREKESVGFDEKERERITETIERRKIENNIAERKIKGSNNTYIQCRWKKKKKKSDFNAGLMRQSESLELY